MRLEPGFTRFRGQIINGLEARELRRLARRLRQQLQARCLNHAEDTFHELLEMSQCGCDPVGMRTAINDLYEDEWEKAGLPNNYQRTGERAMNCIICIHLDQQMFPEWWAIPSGNPEFYDWMCGQCLDKFQAADEGRGDGPTLEDTKVVCVDCIRDMQKGCLVHYPFETERGWTYSESDLEGPEFS